MIQEPKKEVENISTQTTYPEKFKEFADQPPQVQGAPSKLQKSDKTPASEMAPVSYQQIERENIESDRRQGEKLPTEIKLT